LNLELSLLFHQIHFPLVLAIAVVVGAAALIRRKAAECAPVQNECIRPTMIDAALAAAGLVAALVALLPRQTFTQYFMVPLLLLIFATVPFWCWLFRQVRSNALNWLGGVLLAGYAAT